MKSFCFICAAQSKHLKKIMQLEFQLWEFKYWVHKCDWRLMNKILGDDLAEMVERVPILVTFIGSRYTGSKEISILRKFLFRIFT